jgi:hypothetical protein
MAMYPLIGLLVGMLIAQRFTVLILIPLIMLSIIVIGSIGVARGAAVWTILVNTGLTVIALQIGYLLGTAAHHLTVLARASRIHAGTVPNALHRRREAH